MVINLKKVILVLMTISICITGFIILRPDQGGISGNTAKPELNKSIVETKNYSTLKTPVETINFFAEYRIERERNRGQQIELLRDIMNNPGNQTKAREAASLRLVRISEDLEKEMKAENLVKSKGFRECVVITQPHNTTVVIQAPILELKQEEDIIKLVSDTMGCEKNKISVIMRKPNVR